MDKVMVITGGSRGIGAATASLAAREGYDMCITYRTNQQTADHVVDEIKSHGVKAIAVKADLSIETDILRLFSMVDHQLGVITALVNNAGVLERQMRLDEMTADRLNRIFTVNITGSFLCAREAVRRMSTRYDGTGGAIVNISSVASRLGSPGEYVDYAASKGALDTMTIGLAKEVAAEGIRVNGVRPGIIHTDIHANGGDPGRVERLKEYIPMKRGGQPEEIAHAILWLLSEQASYVTGTFIDVSGGR